MTDDQLREMAASCRILITAEDDDQPFQEDVILKHMRQVHDQAKPSEEDRRKIEAINLMLTCPNPVVQRLAERYIEGTKEMAVFMEFLRTHPIPEIDNADR